jgi:Domain of unknown function (DUF1877)
MGMVFCMRTVSDATLRGLLADPESIDALLDAEDAAAGNPGQHEGQSAELDKAWHAIHYLLTGSVWEGRGPEAFLLAGGTPIGDIDVGYGPARGLTVAETREVAAALDKISAETLAGRFDGAKLDAAEIYPEIWVRDGQDGLDYILEFYQSLRSFVGMAAQKKMGMLLFIT